MFKGIITAIVTPFKSGEIDWDAFADLIERQIAAGIHGLVVSGTTGESPTLSKEEKKRLFQFAVERVKGRTALIAGTGSNNTADSVEFSKWAANLKVDGLLTVVPYYNKPTQEGMYQHFTAIANAVTPMPIVLYNVPSRTVADLLPETIARLATIPNVTCVKEATGKMERVTEILRLAPHLSVLSGDDGTFFDGMQNGMRGVISVASNVFPKPMVELYNHFVGGDRERAESLNGALAELFSILFCETSPAPVKEAAAYLGWMRNEVRLPLVPISDANKPKLYRVIESLKIQFGA